MTINQEITAHRLYREGYLDGEIANEINTEEFSIRRFRKRHGLAPNSIRHRQEIEEACKSVTDYDVEMPDLNSGEEFDLPDADEKIHSDWPVINIGEYGILLISDIHVPSYDKSFLIEAVSRARESGVSQCAILGDLANVDGFSRRGKDEQQKQRLQEECIAVGKVLRWLAQYFKALYVIPGNHDERHSQQTKKHFDHTFLLPRLFDAPENCQFFEHGVIDFRSGGRRWIGMHGANYCKNNPTKPLKDHAEEYQANIVMGHQHLSERGFSRCGRFEVVAMGGMADDRRLGYRWYQPRTHPCPVPGYVILIGGEALMWTKQREKND